MSAPEHVLVMRVCRADMTSLRVTVDDLRKLGACAGDVLKFKAEFGSYADVTIENLASAFKAGINVDWWATQVFGSEYERVTAPALAEYERVTAPALAEYERVTAQALAEYERVRAQAIVARADARAAREVQP